jgi:predicted metal-binding protein
LAFRLPNVYISCKPHQPKYGKTMTIQKETEQFDFLKKRALELGAADAKIIPASKIVVEDRVVLKCKVGCNNYGKTLACPPYTPSAEEFRKIVSEYSYAMFMKFTSKAEADVELQKSLSKSETDSTLPSDIKEKADKFWAAWKKDKKEMLESVVTLEKEAMRKGYSLAISFVSGSCQLCEKCNTKDRICAHPEMARYSEDAVGVNVKKTAKNAGISFIFPFPKNPESFALLLID